MSAATERAPDALAPGTPAPGTLRLRWRDQDGGAQLAEALLGLFGPYAERIELPSSRGWLQKSPSDAAKRLREGTRGLRLRLPPATVVELSPDDSGTLSLSPAAVDDAFADLTWFQADPLLRCPEPVLAAPLLHGAVHTDLLHALVALAHRCAPLQSAEFDAPGTALRWNADGPGLRLVATAGGARWRPSPSGPAESLRCVRPEPDPASPELIESLRELLDDAPDLAAAAELLAAASRTPLRITDLDAAPATFHHPPPGDAILRLVPEAAAIRVELDSTLDPDRAAHALAHAAAHLLLGHVRPGEAHGHWDTWATLADPNASRRWDRAARERLPRWSTPAAPQRASLAECTPREKAWLVLLDHIGRMVGELHTLHPSAAAYQAAAYQRQAAQRLVAQVDEYGGAMLCDGVGLGKTYVATTVLVHYANARKDELAAAGRSFADDPFRVTILAPNSVVSTWQREAIPPLAAHGVPLATVRVISHTKLSRILPTSDILARAKGHPSDIEHLLLSDLVVVDEAHNFRTIGANRTTVLRDLLRLQPRKDVRRKVLLLTATPVNNSLEDLRQQAALLFSKPLWFNDNLTADGYRRKVQKDVADRVARARQATKSDATTTILIHGTDSAPSSRTLHFRDDLHFGVNVPRVGDYLKDQEKRLTTRQQAVRAAMQSGQPLPPSPTRIAGELLDRVVVQRSRALCKQIEREQGSETKLLFRPDAPAPEKLVYEDVYDGTRDVLARFMPLFGRGDAPATGPVAPLSLKVYMWAHVRDGLKSADEESSVVGLQRVLVLKRLESSPVAFLITLLRLLALHAHRLHQLLHLSHDLGARDRAAALDAELIALLDGLDPVARDRLDLLLTGAVAHLQGRALLTRWAAAHSGARPAAGADDPAPAQFDLFAAEDEGTAARRDQLDRLWGLRDDLVRDFTTLLDTAPALADIVFGRFDARDWPRRFIAGGQDVDWPTSNTWALRVITDSKLHRLVARLLRARADGQKVIVFSQFTDTLAYIASVLRALLPLDHAAWTAICHVFGTDLGAKVTPDDLHRLVATSEVVSGETEDRDRVIHAFAPFYRLEPQRPIVANVAPDEQRALLDLWREDWANAIRHPIDVLFATDVLAEGVNLQDAALLVNYDVHWNPVRMIQRSGRIDRRLRPAIEEAHGFPDLEALAAELDLAPPRYWWHDHPGATPVTVNLLLPDALEAELQLRERLANKTLAIDFTLGLEQGTGAEADWMADYRYRGVSALNSWQGDRAIEQVAGYQERLRRLLTERAIDPAWVHDYNGWLREEGTGDEGPLLAFADLGRRGADTTEYTRFLTPLVSDGVPHWLWTTRRPGESLLNTWLVLDAKTWPPATRQDLPWSADASRPVTADDLLGATRRVVEHDAALVERGRECGRPLQQGLTAISAGYLETEHDRLSAFAKRFCLLQLARFSADAPVPRRGLARPCPTCGAPPGMHKCCPRCGATACGEAPVEARFGFRRMSAKDGAAYEIPQPWCRACRSSGTPPSPDPREDVAC